MTTDPTRQAVEAALVSDRLTRLEEFEREERVFHGQLLGVCEATRDGVHELVGQGSRREEREAARQERLEAERAETRKWWRQLLSERVVGPVLAALASGGGVAWLSGLLGSGGGQ